MINGNDDSLMPVQNQVGGIIYEISTTASNGKTLEVFSCQMVKCKP